MASRPRQRTGRHAGHARAMFFAGVLFVAAAARGDVEFNIGSEPYFVGSPIIVSIDVINEPEHQPPTMPPIDGAEVRGPTQSRSSQVSIIGRRQSVTESVSYRFEIIPRRPGRLEIPSIELVVGGQPKRTSPKAIQVTKADAEDLLFVEVHADRDAIYLGESLEIRLEIWLRPLRQSGFGDYNDMWQCIDLRRSAWGPFAALLQDTRNVHVQKQARKGQDSINREYYVYRLSRTHWPERSGPLDLGEINIIVEYPLQVDRDRSVFSFFNEPRVLRARTLSLPAAVDPILVKPVPTVGQPPGYNGAVGQYQFDVEAKPTEVHVGDPITLTLSIRGQGRLELLQPPKLEEMEELIRNFKLPSDLLAGVVEGNVKRFTQTIRARDASISEIPALPFSYFDPRAEKFVTVRSDPIPLKVAESERLSVSRTVEAETGQRISTRLTRQDQGILANYYDADLLLADQSFVPGAGTAACVALPPAAYLGAVLVRRRRERLRSDVGYARRHRARGRALGALQAAAAATDPAERAAAVLAALAGYVADRCALPPGALTRAESVAQLRDRNVSEEHLRCLDEVLAHCETVRYAGSSGEESDALVQRARQCIDALERQRF